MKKSFVLYHDQYEPIKTLSLEDKGKLLDAIFAYNLTGEEIELEGMVRMAFMFFKGSFDRNNEEWKKRAERNKENGKKGGRPKKNKNDDLGDNPPEPKKPSGFIENPENPTEPKKAVSVSVPVSASVTEVEVEVEEHIPPDGGSNQKPKRKPFKPPTEDEVRSYCIERQNSVDPGKFIDHYEAANWHRGKTKISNWKACVRTWEKNSFGSPNQPSSYLDQCKREQSKPQPTPQELLG